MGVFDKLGSRIGLKRFSVSNKSATGYHCGGQAPSVETDQLATYLLPGSAVVLVSGSPSAKSVASLQPGEKILGVDVVSQIATGGAMIWATLQSVEVVPQTAQVQNTIVVGLGGDDSVALKAEQVILTRDRKKAMSMQPVRRLEIGVDSIIAFNGDGLQWRGKKAKEVKKISSLRLVRERNSSECLYRLTAGSTHHSLLMSSAQDASHFLVMNSSNSTLNLKAVDVCNKPDETLQNPKMEIKNTFINVEVEEEDRNNQRLGGIPRSYSDTDIRKLAIELEMEEASIAPKPHFADDDLLDLRSNPSSALTSKSRTSSFLAKSEVSSMSGGSVVQVRLGTQPVMYEDGRQESSATDAVQLTEYNNLPVNEFGVRLPAASGTHQPGRRSRCRKCAFYNTFSIKKGKTCKNGALCDFCHETHDRFIHRR